MNAPFADVLTTLRMVRTGDQTDLFLLIESSEVAQESFTNLRSINFM